MTRRNFLHCLIATVATVTVPIATTAERQQPVKTSDAEYRRRIEALLRQKDKNTRPVAHYYRNYPKSRWLSVRRS